MRSLGEDTPLREEKRSFLHKALMMKDDTYKRVHNSARTRDHRRSGASALCRKIRA